MKTSVRVIYSFAFVLAITLFLSSFRTEISKAAKLEFPYKRAGLTERQAAAHLLSRFTYGPRAGDVDQVVKMGLEKWFMQQLEGGIEDEQLNKMLTQFDDINLTNTEVENKYPRQGVILRMVVKDGIIAKDSIDKGNRKGYAKQLNAYMEDHGLKSPSELYRQFISQKMLRAVYTNNQLHELLTDFWFNHFNVSLTKGECATFVPAFERDVIRPNVTGKFQNLLLATAKSPAMLLFLDNFSSSGQPQDNKSADIGMTDMMGQAPVKSKQTMAKPKAARPKKKKAGLNENYAREVMELHTLGVDGGYTQNDVTQAARVLTGWTIAPMGDQGYGSGMQKTMEKLGESNLQKEGYVHEGDFLFVPSRHDNGEKTVLGKHFPANGEYEEGVALLSMLAHHPSTAKFISRKIAIRFVNDQPSQKLVNQMAKTFMSTDGDIKKVMITMVSSPEFWKTDALREKTKSPFELAISAVRSLDAKITQPYQLFTWINKMGQKMYYYQAPTGFPDRGQYWINTGSLLSRMNFGLALASQRIPGIKINLASLNNNHEPESAEAALITYSKLIMPERDLSETLKRLKPMLTDPELENKVQKASEKTEAPQPVPVAAMANEDAGMMAGSMETMNNNDEAITSNKRPRLGKNGKRANAVQTANGNNSMLAQVVGVIVGSPEFQRK